MIAAEKNNKNDAPFINKSKITQIKRIVIGLFICLLAGAIAFSWINHQNKKSKEKVTEAIFLERVNFKGQDSIDLAENMDKLALEFKSTPASFQALVTEFAIYFEKEQYEQAEKVAERFIASYPAHSFTPRMQLALCQLLINQGKTEEAKKKLQNLEKQNYPEIEPMVKLNLAQLLENEAEEYAGDNQEYLSKLEDVREKYADIIAKAEEKGWPRSIILPANFSLIIVKDKLAGYKHKAPISSSAIVVNNQEDLAKIISEIANNLAEEKNDDSKDKIENSENIEKDEANENTAQSENIVENNTEDKTENTEKKEQNSQE